jgi:hypothetical protein
VKATDADVVQATAAYDAAMAASADHVTWGEQQSHLGVPAGGVAIEEPVLVDDLAVPMTGG